MSWVSGEVMCRVCREFLPVEAFKAKRRGGPHSVCRRCYQGARVRRGLSATPSGRGRVV